jgi:FkbM family methyltransferase
MKERLGTKGFYVDIGCHGPRRGNNTYWLYKRGWKGILVDIEDEKVLSCRLARPRDTTQKCAVTDHEGTVQVYSDKPFSTTSTIIAPDVDKPNVKASSSDVRATTLTKLLADLMAPNRFELLSIDTEGSDLNVLRGLDFKIFQPTFICVEELYKESILDIEASEVNELLVHNGYHLISVAGFSLIYKLAGSRAD